MSAHIARIDTVDQQVARLNQTTTTKTELDSLRKEYRKLIESEHMDGVELRARVWAM